MMAQLGRIPTSNTWRSHIDNIHQRKHYLKAEDMHVGPSSNFAPPPKKKKPCPKLWYTVPILTLTSFMKISMTDPTCSLSPLSSPRTQLEYCRLVGVQFSGLLRSHVALLSIQKHCELLESMGRVSGFSHTPKALSAWSSTQQRGPARAACSALAVMFLPEY